MEESLGAQYAIQIAVHTLRDRCKSLQHRIAILEDENMNLRIRCSRNEENEHSLSELDKLKEHITEVTEQREQLQNKLKMVSSENQELWGKLGKLTFVNKNLGDQLNKITDTVNQHTPLQTHTGLIRSKTFTQDEPQTRFLQKNLEVNEKISLELEDISLKLTDSFSKQKMELDKLCSEIDGMQYGDNIITENFGFCYEEEIEDGLMEDIKYLLENLKELKEEGLQQKNIIEKNIISLKNLQEKSVCKTCEKKKTGRYEKSTSTSDIPKFGVDKFTEALTFDKDLKSTSADNIQENDKICPICTKVYQKDVDFAIFQQHVEDHFHPDVSSYELL